MHLSAMTASGSTRVRLAARMVLSLIRLSGASGSSAPPATEPVTSPDEADEFLAMIKGKDGGKEVPEHEQRAAPVGNSPGDQEARPGKPVPAEDDYIQIPGLRRM